MGKNKQNPKCLLSIIKIINRTWLSFCLKCIPKVLFISIID